MPDLSHQTDELIIESVRNGDRELFAEIIRRYEQKLLRYAMYLIHDESLATDVVQETFIKAYVNAQSFNIQQRFSSWIYRIAHNEAMNSVRKYKQNAALDVAHDFDSTVHLEDDLIQKELLAQLHHCLNQMHVLYREPLVLFFLEEKSYQEISDVLRIPINTVGTRINRAKQLVKKICQKKL